MANIIKGLLPSGKAPSVLKAEIIELVKTEAPAPDLTPYATKEELAQSGAVQRLTLTAPITAISIDTWDINQAYALVITQDSAGGRKATYSGEDIPVDTTPSAATITAWVHDGTGWVWRSSAAEPAPTAPAAWAEGTTVRTDAVEATAVTFVFSQPIPARVAVQYRAGSADSWRTAQVASPTSVKVTGLTATTSYPAFDFQLLNAAGASSPITAQAFQTPAKPPAWEILRQATFSTGAKTPLASYTPEVGETPTQVSQDVSISVEDGATLVEYATKNYVPATLRWTSMPNSEQTIRLSTDYSGIAGTEAVGWVLYAGTADGAPRFSVSITSTGIIFRPIQNVTLTETSGKTDVPPAAGTAVLEVKAGKVTLTINGVLYRSWDLTVNNQTPFQRAEFVIGGQSVYPGKPVSPTRVSEIKVEVWK